MEPFVFQKGCVKALERFKGRALLAAEPGLGKTLMALLYLKRNPDALPAVVVCPAVVKYFWEQQVHQVLGFKPNVLEGRAKKKGNIRTRLQIVNYDILASWLVKLKSKRPMTIILDECHFACNPNAKRTKAVKQLCRKVPHVLALSGTPLVNRPIELFPVLQILKPKIFTSRWKFGQEYCNARWTPWGWKFDGVSKLDELRELLLDNGLIRRRKKEVLRDLPDKIREVVPLPISDRALYRTVTTDFLDWLKVQDPDKAKRAARAEQLSKMGYLLQLVAKLKFWSVVEWINQFLDDTNEKLVVFAVHKKMIQALSRQCQAKSVIIDGSVTGRARAERVSQFQEDKRTRLVLGNLQAAGVGITLTAASTVAFAELGWRPGDHTQAEDRIHRIGTKQTAWCYYLVAAKTIEQRLCEILQKKQKTLSAVLDGGSTDTDINVFDLLMREVQRGKTSLLGER